jgi:hypothetical protein
MENLVNVSGWVPLWAVALFVGAILSDGIAANLPGVRGILCGFSIAAICGFATWLAIGLVSYERR